MSTLKHNYTALLLDLDGTLLDIDLDRFIVAYIEALSGRFRDQISQQDFARHLFGATAEMVKNTEAHRNNREIFYTEFIHRIGLDLATIEPIVDDFYKNDFPQLSCWGKKIPQAVEIVEIARSKNLPLVLATNPIFPETAVLQRLSWAGLKADDFQLITTMDNMHYCKPQLQYYLEISEKIACAPSECLMAGNDTLEDLIAAKTGMQTFLVEDFILNRGEQALTADYSGTLDDLLTFIQHL